MTEGPRVNFVMRGALFEIYTWILCVSYLHEKQTSTVEFNPYFYTLSKLSRFGQEIFVFSIQNSRRNGHLIRHVCGFMEKWMSKFFLCSSQQKTLEV